jgi:hypothetical protein
MWRQGLAVGHFEITLFSLVAFRATTEWQNYDFQRLSGILSAESAICVLLNSLSSLLTRYVQQQTDISLLSPDNFYCSHTLSRISGHGGRAEEAAGAAHGRYLSPL